MKITLSFFLSLIPFLTFSQNVGVTIQPKDSFELEVVSVYPDSFPLIATIFRAENRFGEPLWLLDKGDLSVTENTAECEVVSLRRITDKVSIKVGLVIDHSGSMHEDIYQLYDTLTKEPLYSLTDTGFVFPEGYISPIESAKSAVLRFIQSLNQEKDSIQIVGFSNQVDNTQGFTNDTINLKEQVTTLNAGGGTALYDAMYTSLRNLEKEKGIKVVIALTDGLDNSSSINAMALLDSALKYEIPIFNIALGSAVIDSLQLISDSTGGSLYYSKSALALEEIYKKISKNILAIYELKHLSENLNSADSTRDFELRFNIDSLQLMNNSVRSELPESVLKYLEEKEKDLLRRYKIYGGVGLSILLLLGGFLLYKRKAKKILITSIYPNPADLRVSVEYKIPEGIACRLVIIDVRLKRKLEEPIPALSSSINVDVSGFSRGVLLIKIVDETGKVSNTVKLLKK